jgi:hypothetical protein
MNPPMQQESHVRPVPARPAAPGTRRAIRQAQAQPPVSRRAIRQAEAQAPVTRRAIRQAEAQGAAQQKGDLLQERRRASHTPGQGPGLLGTRRRRMAAITAGVLAASGLSYVGVATAQNDTVTSGALVLQPGTSAGTKSGVTFADGGGTVSFNIPGVATGGGLYVGLKARSIKGGSYLAKVHVLNNGKVTAGLSKLASGTEQRLGAVAVPELTVSGPTTLNAEVSVSGTSPVKLAVRTWAAGAAKPAWQYQTTDSGAGLSTRQGDLETWGYLSSGASRAMTVAFSGLAEVKVPVIIPTTPAEPPKDPAPKPTTTAPKPTTPAAKPTTTAPKPTKPAPTVAPTTAVPVPPKPPAGGQPGPGNTGVPAGTQLKVHQGNLVIDTPGATYDSLDIRGFVDVRAANVKITKSIIRGGVATGNRGVVNVTNAGVKNFVLEDSEVRPDKPSVLLDGVLGGNFTLRRVEVNGGVDTVKAFKSNVTIEASWLHGTQYFANDPNHNGGPTHNDGIQVQGGDKISIVGNRIEGASNAAIMVTQNSAATTNLAINRNWLDNGGCSVNIVPNHLASMSTVELKGNQFGNNTRVANCAVATTPAVSLNASGNMITGTSTPARINVW